MVVSPQPPFWRDTIISFPLFLKKITKKTFISSLWEDKGAVHANKLVLQCTGPGSEVGQFSCKDLQSTLTGSLSIDHKFIFEF